MSKRPTNPAGDCDYPILFPAQYRLYMVEKTDEPRRGLRPSFIEVFEQVVVNLRKPVNP